MHDSTPPARSFPHGETAFVRQALLHRHCCTRITVLPRRRRRFNKTLIRLLRRETTFSEIVIPFAVAG